MISIAIDGPAGAGKSTVAKELARKLGYMYIDTGALYRTVAIHLLKNKIACDDIVSITKALKNIEVSMSHENDGQHVYLCGEDVTGKIRTTEVSEMASASSVIKEVRDFLFNLQTDMAKKYNVVMDGRDIGTVVLPKAQVKVFLTASADERANRRFKEMQANGSDETYESVLETIKLRDERDSSRAVAPLKPADDAVILDSTTLNFEEVVKTFIKIIDEKLK